MHNLCSICYKIATCYFCCQVNLLGIYEMLADIHWKLGDIDAVLMTLTRSVELEHSHLVAAVELWCRIKREQLRVGNTQIANQ